MGIRNFNFIQMLHLASNPFFLVYNPKHRRGSFGNNNVNIPYASFYVHFDANFQAIFFRILNMEVIIQV